MQDEGEEMPIERIRKTCQEMSSENDGHPKLCKSSLLLPAGDPENLKSPPERASGPVRTMIRCSCAPFQGMCWEMKVAPTFTASRAREVRTCPRSVIGLARVKELMELADINPDVVRGSLKFLRKHVALAAYLEGPT